MGDRDQNRDLLCSGPARLYFNFYLYPSLCLQLDYGCPKRSVNRNFLSENFKSHGQRMTGSRIWILAPAWVSNDRDAKLMATDLT